MARDRRYRSYPRILTSIGMSKLILLTSAVFLIIGKLLSQQIPAYDPRIAQIVSDISASNIKSNVERLVSFRTRQTLSDTSSRERGIGAARRWITAEFERYAGASNGRMKVEQQSFITPSSNRIPHPATIVNVIATLVPANLKTQTPKRIFIVSGHYDSRATNVLDSTGEAPGANDDGSGTAIVLELARVMSTYDVRTPIKFIAFAGEEQGLIGSTHCAEIAAQEHWDIEGVFNNDIVGNTHGGNGDNENSYVRLFSQAYSGGDTGTAFKQRNALGLENDGPSRTLARYIKEASEHYVPHFSIKLIYRGDRFLRGGDHLPFHDRGFAAVRFTEAKENFDRQHQSIIPGKESTIGDLPQYMDFDYCANVARMNAASLASLAFAPLPPAGAIVTTKNLEYGTTIHWHNNNEPDLAGYRVRSRETSSASWQFTEFTTDTLVTLNISKDDFIFGIQAVDKGGNASLPVIPLPGH